MKRILSFVLTLCMLAAMLQVSVFADEMQFTDMPPASHWSYDALQFSVKNGLLNGSNGKIMASADLTRVQLAAIINRAFGAFEKEDISNFTDIPKAYWGEAEIAKAVNMGTFQGSGDKMRPNDPISREEAFVVLARAFKLEPGTFDDLKAFPDANTISSWAMPQIAAMVKAGYVNGSNGLINPKSKITREQFAQVLFNMIEKIFNKAGTYDADVDGSLVINVPGVTLKNLTVKGDLIIGEGVGDGDIYLDNVIVEGNTVVRGGGENSIHITNRSSIGNIIIAKTASGNVRIHSEKGCNVKALVINDGCDDVIIEGQYNNISVQSDVPVVLNNAEAVTLTVSADSAKVSLEGSTKVTSVKIAETAADAKLDVSEKSTVTTVVSEAKGVEVSGEGTIKTAIISGDETKVSTKGTVVSVVEGTKGVVSETEKPSGGGGSYIPSSDPTPDPEPQGCQHTDFCFFEEDSATGKPALICSSCGSPVNLSEIIVETTDASIYSGLMPAELSGINSFYSINTDTQIDGLKIGINTGAALIVDSKLVLSACSLYVDTNAAIIITNSGDLSLYGFTEYSGINCIGGIINNGRLSTNDEIIL